MTVNHSLANSPHVFLPLLSLGALVQYCVELRARSKQVWKLASRQDGIGPDLRAVIMKIVATKTHPRAPAIPPCHVLYLFVFHPAYGPLAQLVHSFFFPRSK